MVGSHTESSLANLQVTSILPRPTHHVQCPLGNEWLSGCVDFNCQRNSCNVPMYLMYRCVRVKCRRTGTRRLRPGLCSPRASRVLSGARSRPGLTSQPAARPPVCPACPRWPAASPWAPSPPEGGPGCRASPSGSPRPAPASTTCPSPARLGWPGDTDTPAQSIPSQQLWQRASSQHQPTTFPWDC